MLPKALQQAIDDSPAPSESNVFDFEAGNKIVQADTIVEPVDTSKDNWLEDFIASEGDPSIVPDVTGDLFSAPDNDDDAFSLPDLEGKSQVDELREIIDKLENKVTTGERQVEEDEALNKAKDAIREKYGDIDEDLLENFADLFQTFRAKIGVEFGEDMLTNQTAAEKRIADLEAKIESMSASDDGLPIVSDDATPGNYRDLMAEAVPDYQKIVSSQNFKRLLETPIDKDNPEFTFNKKLGRLYSQRKTADIMKFFSSYADKYMAADGSGGAVVDSGSSSPSKGGQGAKATLSPDRLRSIFKQVMNGSLKLSEADMLKLRTLAAKQNMD